MLSFPRFVKYNVYLTSVFDSFLLHLSTEESFGGTGGGSGKHHSLVEGWKGIIGSSSRVAISYDILTVIVSSL